MIGEGGGTVVVENNLRVTYYRPGGAPGGGYGRAGSFYEMAKDDDTAVFKGEPHKSVVEVLLKKVAQKGPRG